MVGEKVPLYNEEEAAAGVGQAYAYSQLEPFAGPLKTEPHPAEQEAMISPLKKALIMRGVKILSISVTVFLFAVCWSVFYSEAFSKMNIVNADWIVYSFYTVFVTRLGRIYRAYKAGASRVSELIYSQVLTNVVTAGIMYAAASAICLYILNPVPLLGLILVQGLWSVLWSLVANKVYFSTHPPRKTVIIYKQDDDLRKLEQIRYFSSRFDVQKFIKAPRNMQYIIHEMEGNTVAFIAGIDMGLRNQIINHCIENNIQSYIVPQVGDVIMAGAEHMQVFTTPIMRVRRASPSYEYLFAKRVLDVIGSLVGVVVASPIMLVVALAIKLYDGGPVLYRQARLTKDRQVF